MALTNLYNTCVSKGSTPSAQTISAIVTAVQNISTGVNLEEYGLSEEDFDTTGKVFNIYTDSSSGSYYAGGFKNAEAQKYTAIVFPETYNGKELLLS